MQNSTDYNLNNPFKKLGLNIEDVYKEKIIRSVRYITADEYLCIVHDPSTTYVIEVDGHPTRIYVGDNLIEDGSVEVISYLVGYDKAHNEFTVMMDKRHHFQDQVTEVCRFKEASEAIIKMQEYNNIGSHGSIPKSIYRTLCHYIDKEISILDLIISIMMAFGYKDTQMQDLIEMFKHFDVLDNRSDDEKQMSFNPLMLREMRKIISSNNETLFNLYIGIYNVIIKYNFFKNKAYKVENPDLSSVIDEIIKVFSTNTLDTKLMVNPL